MSPKENLPFLPDDRAVSVVFGTLLLILITIVMASGLALFLSETQAAMMEREEHISAVENEQLRILSLHPSGNGSHWNALNITLLNLNTADSKIASVAINRNFILNYFVLNASGGIEHSSRYPDYPVIYNARTRPRIEAADSLSLYVPFDDIVINTTEPISTSRWANMSQNCSLRLTNHPVLARYPADCDIAVYNLSDNNSLVPGAGYSIHTEDESPFITLFSPVYGGSMNNNSSYRINYSSYFKPLASHMSLSPGKPLRIELITSLINIFEEIYIPPVPLASVNYETERWNTNGTFHYQDVLVLDASDSFDEDGSIVSYRWAAWDANSTPIYDYNLTGKIVRASLIDPSDYGITIDLEVVDDMGMVSRLSERGGKIRLY